MLQYIVAHVSMIWAQSSGGAEDSQCQEEMFREVRSEEGDTGLGEVRGWMMDNGGEKKRGVLRMRLDSYPEGKESR